MTKNYYFKIFNYTFSLLAVVLSIYQLTNPQNFITDKFKNVFNKKIQWCKTRISSIEYYENKMSKKLIQNGNNWYAEGKEINSLDMEKWFGKYCFLKIDKHTESLIDPQHKSQKIFTVHFVDGTKSRLEKLPSNSYQFEGVFFESKLMDNALQDFKNLTN